MVCRVVTLTLHPATPPPPHPPLPPGIIIAVCSCYGRAIMSKLAWLCCRRRRRRKQQDAFEQIAALRQQLHNLQTKMSTEEAD